MLSIHDPLLIFTDLDGTLLNSHTFEWQPAAPWLTRLHESGVPVMMRRAINENDPRDKCGLISLSNTAS